MIWPTSAPPELVEFLSFARAQEEARVPYIWGAKGLHLKPKDLAKKYPIMEGSDCSGLVTCALWYATKGAVDWRADHNCNRIWEATHEIKAPLPGDLAFYGHGKNLLTHVMIVNGDGRALGASGGNSDTTSIEIAHRMDARVKFKHSPDYRVDLKGFSRITF